MVYLCNHGGRLNSWLPALTALPSCHSLYLKHEPGDFLDIVNAFDCDHLTLRSGLVASPALRLLCWNIHYTLPLVAAKRTELGLPPVVTGPAAAKEWYSLELAEAAVETPDARLEQCAILPSPQIDATPSHLTHLCQTRAALMAAKAGRDSASDSGSDLYFESDVGSGSSGWTSGGSVAGDAGDESASDDYDDSESMGD